MATTNSSTLLPHELPLLLSLLSHATVSSISPETGAYVSCANFLLEACNELLRPNCKGSEGEHVEGRYVVARLAFM